VLEVDPFQEAGLTITPHTAHGGESASYRLQLQNKGNVPLPVRLDAADPDEVLYFEFDPPALTLGLGETATVRLLAKPHATFYKGPPQPHPFKAEMRADGMAPIGVDASMLQEALPRPRRNLPLVATLVSLLVVALLAGALVERQPLMRLVAGKAAASPSPTPSLGPAQVPIVLAAVPDVFCMTPSDAQQTIEAAGFKFKGIFEANPSTNGSIFRMQPTAGQKAPQGSVVTVFLSTGPPVGTKGTPYRCFFFNYSTVN
jgi:hypothetical protein